MAFKNFMNSVKLWKPRRSAFDLSHFRAFSCQIGELTPILCRDILPGDTWRVKTDTLIRFSPLVAPIMSQFNVYVHYFFVPNRLLWSEWEDFITGGRTGTLEPAYPYAYFNASKMANEGASDISNYFHAGSLMDHLGFPVSQYFDAGADEDSMYASSSVYCSSTDSPLDLLPFAAYQKIYCDYYRDQNLEPDFFTDQDIPFYLSGPVEISDYQDFDTSDSWSPLRNLFTLRKRAWEKDYFTSALPWTQRGPQATLPIGFTNPEVNGITPDGQRDPLSFARVSNGQVPPDGNLNVDGGSTAVGGQDVYVDGGLYANIDQAASVPTINEVRSSFALQRWLEKNALGGSRYIEQILSHFGVRSSDSRLQRAEYLGGGRIPVSIGDVLQTSGSQKSSTSTFESPQANYAGVGTAVGSSPRFKRHFEEHGWLLGIMSVIPRSVYQQGVPRQFMRRDKTDFAWPEFAHLGEQEVKTAEIYAMPYNPNELSFNPFDTFGYQARYGEYKTIPSSIHGQFRDTLNFWHAGRIFAKRPTLSKEFVHVDDQNFSRLFAFDDGGNDVPQLYCELLHNIQAVRPLPKYGTPSSLNHT